MEQTPEEDNEHLAARQLFQSLQKDLKALRKQDKDLQKDLKALRKQDKDLQRQLKELTARKKELTAKKISTNVNDALQNSTDTQCTQFMHIPLEIREMIWELAVPSRLLGLYADVESALSVPTVAHVCRESRRVFLSRKKVDALTGRSRHLSGASQLWRLEDPTEPFKPAYWSWFTPHKDVLLLNTNAMKLLEWACAPMFYPIFVAAEHIIMDDAGFWPEFLLAAEDRFYEDEDDMFDSFRMCWDHFPLEPECPHPLGTPAWNLRTVDFAMNSVTKIDRNYPPNFLHRLFGWESVRIVDLRDTETIHGIEQMLVDEMSQCMIPYLCGGWDDGLKKSLDIFKAGGAEMFKSLRAELMEDLIGQYYNQSSRATLPSPYRPRSGVPPWADSLPFFGRRELDMEVTWVKEFTERFTIRPVHVFVRVDGLSGS